MKDYLLLATSGLALGALVVYTSLRARRAQAQVDSLPVSEPIHQVFSTVRATAETQAVPVFAIALTGLPAYLSFLGASLVRSAQRPAMQVLVSVAAVAVLAGLLLLAFQPVDRERRQNRPLFLLMLAFCPISVLFASFGLYGTVVAENLTEVETAAWQDYYRDSRMVVVTQTSTLRRAAAAHYADVSAKLLVYQNQVYNARLENRPFLESPEQSALAPAEQRAADWLSSLLAFPLPPAAPARDRQKAEADLAGSVEAINRLAAGAPPPLAPRGVQIGRYVAASTDPFARALEALKRLELPAIFSIAVCGAMEVIPLTVLLMLRRRGYLREFIEGIGQSIVMVRRVLRSIWRLGDPIAEESHAILVVFRPEVHPGVRFEWSLPKTLAQATFADVCDEILPDIESKLAAAGYHLTLFVNADRMYLEYDLPVLSQLNGGVLVALCERLHLNT